MKFETTTEEDEEIKVWYKSHDCKKDRYAGAIGGAITISFTPTGLSTIVEAKCICGETFHPTNDVSKW